MTKSSFLQKFLTSDIVYEKHSGSYRRLILLHALLYVTAFALIFFSLYNFFILSNRLISVMDLIAAANVLYALYHIKKYKKLKLAMYLGTANLFIFLLSFVYVNQNEHFGLIWTIFFPIFAILIHGHKKGLAFVAVFYAVLFYMAYAGIGVWQGGEWSLTSCIRLASASTVLSLVVWFMELSQQEAEEQLELTRTKEAETMRELERLSITDPLTGLYNRRHFITVFGEQYQTARRHGYYFGFFILDIDFFKQYNDTYGHQEGDHVLSKLASALNEHMRRSEDYLFRLGGEEFCGILVGDDRKNLKEQIMSIITLVDGLNIAHKGSVISENLTVSIGAKIISDYDEYGFKRLYKEADEALFRAKSAGRKGIAFYD